MRAIRFSPSAFCRCEGGAGGEGSAGRSGRLALDAARTATGSEGRWRVVVGGGGAGMGGGTLDLGAGLVRGAASCVGARLALMLSGRLH